MIYSTNTGRILAPYGKEDIKRGLEMILDAGFPAADISLYDDYGFAIGEERQEYAALIRECVSSRGATVNQAHAPFSSTEEYTDRIIPELPRIIEFAAAVGAKVIVVHPIQDKPYFSNKKELFERNIEFYSSLAPYAKKFGIKIGLENMWMRRPVSNYIDDSIYADPHELAEAYDILSDPEAFTVCLDLGHVALCGRDPSSAIEILGSRIGALHVHDVDFVHDSHTLPGQGKIDWDSVCRSLAKIDYKGDFTLEAGCFYQGYPKELWPSALKFMSEVARYYSERVEEYKKLK